MGNNPVNFNDPRGHRPCGDGALDDCDVNPRNLVDGLPSPISSTIELGFGLIEDDGTVVYGKAGLGTVIDDNTIVSAHHVLYNAQNMSNHRPLYMYYWYNNKWNQIDFNYTGENDLLIVNLSEELPEGAFIPAEVSTDFNVEPNQTITSVYNSDESQIEELTTQTFSLYQTINDDGPKYVGLNKNLTLDDGDSGGGVFYNGKLIGVNSAVIYPVWYKPTTWFHIYTIAPYK